MYKRQEYTESTYKIDRYYRYFYFYFDKLEDTTQFEKIRELVENIYTNEYLNRITVNWNNELADADGETGLTLQRDFFARHINYSTHQDVGQMDMYIRMYDELKRSEGDNPTIGIVLCSDTDDDIARYSVMHGNEQLFASKYKLYLPTKEELKAEIETQKAMFYLQQQDNEEKETE